ncbi:MAG TPA: condensation domain-containing protein, partial [Telluria sp.]|nr:condensation domain-containing protein [Telluria sp.]
MNFLERTPNLTLIDVLQYRASPESGTADRIAYTYMADGDNVSGTITFAELDRAARRLAAHLQQWTEPGDRILLVYPPSLDYIVAFYACVYAGVTAVPALPPANARTFPRLLLIAQDAEPRIALAPPGIVGKMRQLQAESPSTLTRLDWRAVDELDDAAAEWHRPPVTQDSLMFLQYTSGSTGAPKGVMVSHGNILANLRLIQASFPMSPDDTAVSWLPPHHDMGLIIKIIFPMYAGSHCIQFPPASFVARPYRWLKAMSDYGARFTAAPNFAYDLCLDKVTEEQKRTLDLSKLAFSLNAAEPVRPATLRRFAAAFAGCGLREAALSPSYGLAEATLWVSSSSVNRQLDPPETLHVNKVALAAGRIVLDTDPATSTEIVSVGPPAARAHHVAIVAPDTCAALPADQVGEVWVHGGSVAQGYWNRPELSADTFAAHTANGRGPYLRTGDLGFVHEGNLYIAGRIKDVMIFNGRNVYPTDVEATVERVHPAFRENGCAAFTLEDDSGTRLVLVQEVAARQKVELAEVIGRLRAEVLEQHEILDIAAVLLVRASHVPRTSSGKIQRSRCRTMYLEGAFDLLDAWYAEAAPDAPAAYQAPANATESMLVRIWEALLDKHPISTAENFFALGGRSLLATQVVARVRDEAGIDLPMQALFECPTIAGLAKRIAGTPAAGASAPVRPAARDGALPLSWAQQRLWFLDQLDHAAGAAYHIPAALRLTGRLDQAALRSALSALVDRHESLRTSFAGAGGEPAQVITPAGAAFPLPMHDLRGLSPAARELKAASLARRDAVEAFDLAHGPLVRARLLWLQDEEHLLLLTHHHIVSDGWSIGIELRELGILYAAIGAGRSAQLPALPIQYADYAAWQRAWLQGPALEAQIGYWRGQLAGAPAVLELPLDRQRPPVPSYRGASHPISLGPALTGALAELGRRHGTTLFMTMLAGWSALLARLSGQQDVVVGTPVANRQRTELEAVVGFFVNMLAMRVRFEDDPTVTQLLAQVKNTALAGYAHQDAPFEKVVEAIQPLRSLAYNPLFQASLRMDSTPHGRQLDLAGVRAELVPQPETSTHFDLSLALEEDSTGGISGQLEYATDLFDAPTIERIAACFQVLLAGMAADDKVACSRLPLLPASERSRVLEDFNATAAHYPRDALLHQLVEVQAARTPD